jgi:hypothetical protein
MPESDAPQEQAERLRGAVDRKSEESRLRSEEEVRDARGGSQDVIDPRAKNSGHKKKTADKWNQ